MPHECYITESSTAYLSPKRRIAEDVVSLDGL